MPEPLTQQLDLVKGGRSIIETDQLGYPALPVLETFLYGASAGQPLPVRAFASLLQEVLATGH